MTTFHVDELSKHCSFVADIGYVAPIVYSERRASGHHLTVVPFLDCPEQVRADVGRLLRDAFPRETEGIEDVEAYVKRHWGGADAMYVLAVDGTCAGCVAVDRKNFDPCISHLTVAKERRGQGLGKVLMTVAERYVTHIGFDYVCLWCEHALLRYYVQQGYDKKDDVKPGVALLRKPLRRNASHKPEPEPASAWEPNDVGFALV